MKKIRYESPLLPPMQLKITCHPEFRQTGALLRFGGMKDLPLAAGM
jgi:hypothetical protein